VKIVIHIGLHRAASTSFQRYLRRHEERLEEAGVLVVTPKLYRQSGFGLFRDLLGERIERLGAEGAAETLRELIALHASEADTLLISDENLLGYMPGKMARASSHRHLIARLARELSRDHEVNLVVILREHVRYLVSIYGLMIMRGDKHEFDEFVGGIERESMMLTPLLATLGEESGASRLSIHAQEQIAADHGADFLGRIGMLLGRKLPAGKLPVANASLPGPMMVVLRRLAGRGIVVANAKNERAGELANALAQDPSRQAARDELAAMIAEGAVEVPFEIEGHMRREFAVTILRNDEEARGRALAVPEALALVERAYADARGEQGFLPKATLERLWRDFEGDRLKIAATVVPEWRDLSPPAGSA
jgi:hypothetical protein